MATILWICGIGLGIFFAWWAIKLIATFLIPAERSGAALLKKNLIQAGVDVRKIPDSAIDEIVSILIHRSKATAHIAAIAGNMPNDKNWRANLVRLIQAYIGLICDILRYGPEQHMHDEVTHILVNYNVVKPKDTNDPGKQFL